MNDFIFVEIIVGLFAVVIAEFFFLNSVLDKEKKEKERLLDENSRLVKALIAKNAHDYVMTTAMDRVPQDEQLPPEEPDAVLEDQLNDKEWLEAMDKQTKAAKA